MRILLGLLCVVCSHAGAQSVQDQFKVYLGFHQDNLSSSTYEFYYDPCGDVVNGKYTDTSTAGTPIEFNFTLRKNTLGNFIAEMTPSGDYLQRQFNYSNQFPEVDDLGVVQMYLGETHLFVPICQANETITFDISFSGAFMEFLNPSCLINTTNNTKYPISLYCTTFCSPSDSNCSQLLMIDSALRTYNNSPISAGEYALETRQFDAK